MMGGLVAEAPPAPILLDEARAFLRLGAAGEEDALLAGLVRAAADTCEAFVGRALLVRAVTETLPAATCWARLGLAPVVAIDGVAALVGEGSVAALAAADYAIDIDAAGEGWVRLVRPIDAARLRVSYRAGMAAERMACPRRCATASSGSPRTSICNATAIPPPRRRPRSPLVAAVAAAAAALGRRRCSRR